MPNLPIKKIAQYGAAVLVLLLIAGSLPVIYSVILEHKEVAPVAPAAQPFPVTVDPKDKTITENTEVNLYLDQPGSPLEANASGVGSTLLNIIQSVVVAISNIPLYQNLASAAGFGGQFVVINPGIRKEQVAELFAKALSWTDAQKKEFLTPGSDINSADPDSTVGVNLPLFEGSYFPGTYFVHDGMTPSDVQALLDSQFTQNVLAHYGTSTEEIVPLNEALTIASIIQRETIGNNDMRLISGIIWNRLFDGMNLQIDSTLQYAKANLAATTQWWPPVTPKDKYIQSPYNTYLNNGLPPTPIANPSVGAILAALNPIETSCLYYFSDKKGNFHCSNTYAEQVALLKKYY